MAKDSLNKMQELAEAQMKKTEDNICANEIAKLNELMQKYLEISAQD